MDDRHFEVSFVVGAIQPHEVQQVGVTESVGRDHSATGRLRIRDLPASEALPTDEGAAAYLGDSGFMQQTRPVPRTCRTGRKRCVPVRPSGRINRVSTSTSDSPCAAERALKAEVQTVKELLSEERIRIPDYQRPYKWTVRNVAQLIDDVEMFRSSGRYRIGTVILHANDQGHLDLVDGQQRYLTLSLIAHHLANNGIDTPPVAEIELPDVGLEISHQNLGRNYEYIADSLRHCRDLADWADFLLERCEVVVLTLASVDEAFQMFDSQNTRGRPLFPTDLLKAFHIREMSSEHAPAELKLGMVRLWEDIPPESVHELFSDYLFKIKRWANQRDVPTTGFAVEHVDLFKGIRESDPHNADNRWAMPYLYAKNYTEDFAQENATLIRYGAMQRVSYPFQIDQPVINGETFFMMVRHYYDLGRRCGLFVEDPDAPVVFAELATTLQHLDVHRRESTHRLTRNLFDCLIFYYVDRFGGQDLDRAVNLVVRYAMALRVEQRQVRRVMVSNYALGSPPSGSETLPATNLFAELREAMRSHDFLRRVLPTPRLERYAELHHFFSAGKEEDT
ncbi:MAG: DUF262 domain-containing protein [Nocardioidaceae bacterium]|jgi:hypothetical protein